MIDGAACAFHADRPAAIECARCGTFVCVGCIVSGELCAPCRTRLHRDGTPWTGPEFARARARRALRYATWALRGTLALLLCALWGLGTRAAAPLWRHLWSTLLGTAVLLGLTASTAAILGYLASRRGRPGPAVAGVVPGWVAVSVFGGGLVPAVVIALFWFRSG